MASILKVDDLRGNAAAGNITITSEGGSATMQLQQGVAKHFAGYTSATSTSIVNSQSLNNSSLTDNGTGTTTFTLTNNMSQSKYPIPDSGGDNNGGYSSFIDDAVMTTSSYRYFTGNDSFSQQDTNFHSCMAFGDLA